MDVAYVTALSALTGTVVGGLTSSLGSWQIERARARMTQRTQEKLRREDLYKEFIAAAAKVYADAAIHNEPSIADVVGLYALVGRMRILSSSRVAECAETVTSMATETYFLPNKTIRELHELVKTQALDPLKAFSEAARDELRHDGLA